MASATYVAQRGLITGHTAGTEYTFDFEIQAIARPGGNDIKVKTESMSGAVETLFFGERRIWTITIVPVKISDEEADELYEFLRSTADGQQFLLDPYGTELSPVLSMSVIREDDGYTEETFMSVDGTGDYVTLSFRAREV